MRFSTAFTTRTAITMIALASIGALVACSGASTTGFSFGDGGTGTGGGSGGGSTVAVLGGGGSDGGGGGLGGTDDEDCPASAKLVYVTGEGSQLYSFLPPSTFKLIGTLSCLGTKYSPTHMTVDRTGTAWVAAWDDTQTSSLFTASTTDASCTKVANWTPQPGGNFSDFALTFIGTSNAADTTLYLLGQTQGDGFGDPQAVLGTFDTTTGALTTIGMPNVASAGGDMTTNGDGTLYYLQDTKELELYELNPTTAAVEKTYVPSAKGGGDQALAFYGGYFFAFENNTVYQFDPKTGQTTTLGKAPLQVTGAGESTCVPTVQSGSK